MNGLQGFACGSFPLDAAIGAAAENRSCCYRQGVEFIALRQNIGSLGLYNHALLDELLPLAYQVSVKLFGFSCFHLAFILDSEPAAGYVASCCKAFGLRDKVILAWTFLIWRLKCSESKKRKNNENVGERALGVGDLPFG